MTFPWKEPTSIYESDGPEEGIAFDYQGSLWTVEPTKESALHSGRTLYKVTCWACSGVIVHEKTTSPSSQIVPK